MPLLVLSGNLYAGDIDLTVNGWGQASKEKED